MPVAAVPARTATSARAGRFLVCPICFNSRGLDPAEGLATNAEIGGTVQLWEWIGNEQVVTFSY